MATRLCALMAPILLGAASLAAQANEIAHISTSSGYVLDNSGGAAVTADWKGQSPISGFTGYGQVRHNSQCLTGNGPAGQQLRWDTCRSGDKSQIWALDRSQLNNELGWCADVEGNRGGAGVRVLAWQCSRAVNQQFKAHRVESLQSAANRISDPAVRQAFIQTAESAKPGSVVSLKTGRLIKPGGGELIGAGAWNVVSKTRGTLIGAGAWN